MNKLVTQEFGDKMAATMRVMKISYCTNKKAHLRGKHRLSVWRILKKKKSTEGQEVQMDVRPGTGAHRVRCCNLTLRLILGFRTYIGLKVFN